MGTVNVEMIGITERVRGASPADCWRYVNRNPMPPGSTCPASVPLDARITWAEEQLRRAGVGDVCQIALSCVGPLPWFVLRLPRGPRGLAIYWMNLLIKSTLVVGDGVVLQLHSQDGQLSARFYDMEGWLGDVT